MQLTSHLPTPYQEFIHLSRYSRWLPSEKRRETWDETIQRYFDFFQEHLKETCDYDLKPELRKELESAVLRLGVMPSMRCLMTAGEALRRENIAGYNCSYVAISRVQAFDEILYVLMSLSAEISLTYSDVHKRNERNNKNRSSSKSDLHCDACEC